MGLFALDSERTLARFLLRYALVAGRKPTMTFEYRATNRVGIVQSTLVTCAALALAGPTISCGSSSKTGTQLDAGSQGGAGGDAGALGGDSNVSVSTVTVSAATRRPRTTTWSVNYWDWMPSFGDGITGTESLVAALKPAILRVGGYNNDANAPNAFDNTQLDRAIAYAHAVGAEPLIQVPHLWNTDGSPATAEAAAAMVQYANVTKAYGVKYFSVGNEPDIYATQGGQTDATKPAIPNYTPSDFCASARTYVTAMKAVDPTITIVGPDLAWQYRPGSDWLTPILQTCGDLFDIVSIHRYPFTSKQATLEAATLDSTAFDSILTSVRSLMQAAGSPDKPLALMEMNVAYDATYCQMGASPGTTGSALWLADGLGTAIEHNLWTSAVWDISDDNVWTLGLIGLPPSHTPRSEYYAYQLYADHFGPTLLDVTEQPKGFRTYASRNATDDTTALIVVNWNTSSAPLAFGVTGLTGTPSSATYTLPALSITAVEIPDNGASSAWTYGEAQHRAGQGSVTLAPGASAAVDAGPPQLTNGCTSDAGFVCSKVTLPNASITTLGTMSAGKLSFGSAPYGWGSYTYGSTGQNAPTATLTPDGNGIRITGGFVPPVTQTWMGVGLYFASASCIDASAYTGVKFDFSGVLGGCALAFGSNYSGDESTTDDATRGSCPFTNSTCYPPQTVVNTSATSDAGPTTIRVPFSSLGGGSPNPTMDPSTIITVQWQLNALSGGPGCSADFTVENVSFY